jgi:hypothetical protein
VARSSLPVPLSYLVPLQAAHPMRAQWRGSYCDQSPVRPPSLPGGQTAILFVLFFMKHLARSRSTTEQTGLSGA